MRKILLGIVGALSLIAVPVAQATPAHVTSVAHIVAGDDHGDHGDHHESGDDHGSGRENESDDDRGDDRDGHHHRGQNGVPAAPVVPVAPACTMKGANIRTLHAPRVHRGERLIGGHATMYGQWVKVDRVTRAFTVNLGAMKDGTYAVHITERVRTAHGRLVSRHTIRALAVHCN